MNLKDINATQKWLTLLNILVVYMKSIFVWKKKEYVKKADTYQTQF